MQEMSLIIVRQMQEIKLLDNINTKFNETENRLFLDETPSGKRRNVEHLDLIEPWMEDTGNPFLNLKSKQLKIKRESPSIKRQSSLILPQNWRSIEKVVQTRQSKILPVMDIGQLNSIKKSYSNLKTRGKVQTPTSQRFQPKKANYGSEVMLPSVKRELLIERKLFLMKNISEGSSPNSSPGKRGRGVRQVISGRY